MLIIDKDSVTATRQRIADPKKIKQAIKDVKKMSSCCGSLSNVSAQLTREVNILENTLAALENGNAAQAADLLQEYIHVLEASCEPSQPNYC